MKRPYLIIFFLSLAGILLVPKSSSAECDANPCTNDDLVWVSNPGGVTTGGGQYECRISSNVPINTPCGSPASGSCEQPACDGSGSCSLHNPLPASTVCRPSTGVCDVAEVCDGKNLACPSNKFSDGAKECDNNLCTTNDTCASGTCNPGAPLACAAPTQCQNPGKCEAATGKCAYAAKLGAACSSGNLCITGETCDASATCSGGAPTDCNDGLSCTADSCNSATGACGSTVNGGFCVIRDACIASGEANPSNPCQICDPARSTSAWSAAAVGAQCDDGLFCTTNEACDATGACRGTARNCTDGFACTADSCNEAADRCESAVAAQSCVIDGTCRAAGDRNPSNSCMACIPGISQSSWSATTGSSCNDGAWCTVNDACDGSGTCRGTARDCTDGIGCTTDSCNEATDRCVSTTGPNLCLIAGSCYVAGKDNPSNPCQACDPAANPAGWSNLSNGTSCGDGNACNGAETCQAGACAAGAPLSCADANLCTDDSCDPASGCQNICKASGTPVGAKYCPGLSAGISAAPACGLPVDCINDAQCDDNDECTGKETCLAGVCQSGTPRNCNDNNTCTSDSCVPATGTCVNTAIGAGTLNECGGCAALAGHTGDNCDNGEIGACRRSGKLVCDGRDALRCDAPAGIPSSETCNGLDDNCNGKPDDGLEETQLCGTGQCAGTKTKRCVKGSDGRYSMSTWGACNTAGNTCNDNNACNSDASHADTCDESGICSGAITLTCDDGKSCTTDGCNSATGCAYSISQGTCLIDGICYASGEINPAAACQVCDPARSNNSWSIRPAGSECRPAAGVCDTQETCDGTSPSCPADAKRAAGSECRSPAGTCDTAEACDGASNNCPVNSFAPPTTVCKAAATAADGSTCDMPENCTGASAVCPSDVFKPQGTECRAGNGADCKQPATCQGSSAVCPANAAITACSMVSDGCCPSGCNSTTDADCRPSCGNGIVERGETCDSQASCLQIVNSCTSTNACIMATATGNTNSCNVACVQTPVSAGTACNDGAFCTTGDTCDGSGTCRGTARDCTDGISCTTDACNEAADMCISTVVAGQCAIDGTCHAAGTVKPDNTCMLCNPGASANAWTSASTETVCDDGDACTIGDHCNGAGSCVGGTDRLEAVGTPVLTPVGGSGNADFGALAVLSDGKLLAAGGINGDIAMVRYNNMNLEPDPTFGRGGIIIRDMGKYEFISSVAIQPDGKYVLGGGAWNGSAWDIAIYRFDGDGNPDPTFGEQGKKIIPISGYNTGTSSIAIQPDGANWNIIVAGYANTGRVMGYSMLRLDKDGKDVDPGFGPAGSNGIIVHGSSDKTIKAMAIQPDGKIVTAGSEVWGSYNYNFSVALRDRNGIPIWSQYTGFGSDFDYAYSVAIQPDGKFVAAGAYNNEGFAIARYAPESGLDPAFNVSTPFDGGSATGRSVAVMPNGNIVVAGDIWKNGQYDGAIALYDSNGRLLSKTTTPIGSGDNSINSIVAVPGSGGSEIVAAGSALDGSRRVFALNKYRIESATLTCDDNNPCTTNGCLPEKGCDYQALADNTAVEGGGFCVDGMVSGCPSGQVMNACGTCAESAGPAEGTSCGTCGTYQCQDGAMVCAGDSPLNECGTCGTAADGDSDGDPDCTDCNPGDGTVYHGATETCDGVDNNCDGVADEGVTNSCGGCTELTGALNDACVAGIGECRRTGSLVCDGENALACNATAGTPGVETCDGLDNDCNRIPDDSLVLETEPCGSNDCTGTRTQTCVNGVPGWTDCDSARRSCGGSECMNPGTCSAAGVCSGTTQKGNGTACGGLPSGECDKQDECRNGACTELFEASGEQCRAAAGECDLAETCNGTSAACPADTKKSARETCSADQNFCTDDMCDGAGTCSHPARPGCVCSPEETRHCYTGGGSTAGVGACREGRQRCSPSGSWDECQGEALPGPEICNGVDDDCNGSVDEGFDIGDSCTAENQNGCNESGTLRCKADGSGAECAVPNMIRKNACGVCGGPDLADLGKACSSAGEVSCAGTGQWVCNAEKNALTCNATPKADGEVCNDGNQCTQKDTCQQGKCAGSEPVVCAAPDQCHEAGQCDSATGKCSAGAPINDPSPAAAGTCEARSCDPQKGWINIAAADGTSCDDNDLCTQSSSCQQGKCAGSSPVVCEAPDQCHEAGQCDSATGKCPAGAPINDPSPATAGTCEARSCDPQKGWINIAATDGTSCDDNDTCTQSDTCQSGKCAGSDPVVCAATDQCHEAGQCDSATGKCSNPAKADGTSCTDALLCKPACSGGVCTGRQIAAETCNGEDDDCNGEVDDGNACACALGATQPCGDVAACRGTQICIEKDGVRTWSMCDFSMVANTRAECDDNLCTTGDTCNADGTCKGEIEKECKDADSCTADSCNPQTGECVNTVQAGLACDDGNACTSGDKCSAEGRCSESEQRISQCISGDHCCPANCNTSAGNIDTDCAAGCGNGVFEEGELCDTGITDETLPGFCPRSCPDADSNACTKEDIVGDMCQRHCAVVTTTDGCSIGGTCVLTGAHNAQDACQVCRLESADAWTTISACSDGDGCCDAARCNATNDADCRAVCGNGVLESGENCDTAIAAGAAGSCLRTCPDDGDNNSCTSLRLVENGCLTSCLPDLRDGCSIDGACVGVETKKPGDSCLSCLPARNQSGWTQASACTNGDGCCAPGCTAANDSDCAGCGNGRIDAGEECDVSACSEGSRCEACRCVQAAQIEHREVSAPVEPPAQAELPAGTPAGEEPMNVPVTGEILNIQAGCISYCDGASDNIKQLNDDAALITGWRGALFCNAEVARLIIVCSVPLPQANVAAETAGETQPDLNAVSWMFLQEGGRGVVPDDPVWRDRTARSIERPVMLLSSRSAEATKAAIGPLLSQSDPATELMPLRNATVTESGGRMTLGNGIITHDARYGASLTRPFTLTMGGGGALEFSVPLQIPAAIDAIASAIPVEHHVFTVVLRARASWTGVEGAPEEEAAGPYDANDVLSRLAEIKGEADRLSIPVTAEMLTNLPWDPGDTFRFEIIQATSGAGDVSSLLPAGGVSTAQGALPSTDLIKEARIPVLGGARDTSGAGGGGCSISRGAGADWLFILILFIPAGLLALLRCRE